MGKNEFTSFINKLLSQSQTLGCIKLGDMEQTYVIIADMLQKSGPGFKFDRRCLLACILRIAKLASERQNGASLGDHPSALRSIMRDCFDEYLRGGDGVNKDMQQLRKRNIFNNRLLSALFRGNLNLIKQKIFGTFLTLDSLQEAERLKRQALSKD